jgi:serine/threonine protein phosphatase 1
MKMPILTTDWQKAPHPAIKPLYVIGDVHGYSNLLKALHKKALELVVTHNHHSILIHLGDLVDRGPHSIECLNLAHDFRSEMFENHVLPGNHELMIMMVLHNPDAHAQWWLDNGGNEFVRNLPNIQKIKTAKELANLIADELNKHRLIEKILRGYTAFQNGKYFFVHAGVPADKSLEEILRFDWTNVDGDIENQHPLWIRTPFLTNKNPFEDNTIIIHGHSPIQKGYPEVHSNRINLDIGSFFNKKLCMMEIIGDMMRFHIAD